MKVKIDSNTYTLDEIKKLRRFLNELRRRNALNDYVHEFCKNRWITKDRFLSFFIMTFHEHYIYGQVSLLISSSFVWAATRKGHEFWCELTDDFCKNFKL